MAGEERTATHTVSLIQDLQKAPYQFGFYQVLRQFECLNKDKPRIGASRRLVDDPVMLGQQPSVAFAPSTLAACEPGKGMVPRLEVFFFGLFGPHGPLPLHLTEYARDRLRNANDPTFKRFADIFHHRMLSLFYRAWAISQPTVQFDRPEEDRIGGYLASLFGMGMPTFRNRDAFPDPAKLHYAGRFVCQTRHPEGLQAMVEDFFGIRARIREFVGQWLRIPRRNQCRLGESLETGILGRSVTIGEEAWECQHNFRFVLGPLGLADYLRFLPGGDSLERLVALVRNYTGDEFAWDINMILRKEEVPPLKLGETSQLGWTTWLSHRTTDLDADDLVLNPFVKPNQ